MMNAINYKIVKSNDLIQCKSNFTALEHRIILLALVQIKPEDKKLKMYKISLYDVLSSKHRSNYHLVRNAVEKLQQSLIRIEEGKKWKSYTFVSKAQGEYGKSYIEIQFHEDIQKFLLGLKSQYTSYVLGNVINFKKNYSLRIYELCKQYQKFGFREMSLDYLRILLSLEKKHKDFYEFRKKVLNPSLEEINEYSDLFLCFESLKQGKKVVGIKFLIEKNTLIDSKSPINKNKFKLVKNFYQILLNLGFTNLEIKNFEKNYTQKRIIDVLNLLENQKDIRNPKAWVISAFREDYNLIQESLRDNPNKLKEKLNIKNIILEKKIEIKNFEELLLRDQSDIREYKKTGQLRNGDILRFSQEKSVQKVIQELEKRVIDTKSQLKKSLLMLKNLESKINMKI